MMTQISESPIDFTRRFIPERLTPLFHTPAYSRLSVEQRLRYNQLHGCYLNEQTIFFESAMARHILNHFAARGLPGGLADGLPCFIAEEAAHSEMFRQLNRRCLPEIYAKDDFHFVRVPSLLGAGLRAWVKRSGVFPFFLWVLLIQEERALFYAREYLREAAELEPNFVSAQRRHLADEAGHIQWDEQLLDWVWPRTSGVARRVNARLFAWMMGEYFTTPRRSGLRVLAELVREFPALQPQWPELRTQMLELTHNRDFHLLAYSRAVTPKAFARFDRWPEFRPLAKVLMGYEPPADAAKPRR